MYLDKKAQFSRTNRATHLWNMQWRDPVKHAPPPRVLPCWIWSLVGGVQTNLGEPEPRPFGWGGVADPWSISYPHVGYHAKFDCCSSNDASERMEVRRITGHSRPAFRGHSESSELTRIDHSNLGPLSYTVSKIRRDIGWFSPLNPYFRSPIRVLPFEFSNGVWPQKLEWWGYQADKMLPYNTRMWRTDTDWKHRRASRVIICNFYVILLVDSHFAWLFNLYRSSWSRLTKMLKMVKSFIRFCSHF